MPTAREFTRHLDEFAPPATAADWDNVGLLLGDEAGAVGVAMTCLTVTPEVVAEAVAEGVNLIVAHHPVLFRGVKKLTSATAEGRLLLPLFRHGIAVYSPHTAFDNCPGGINDGLAARLGLTGVRPLRHRAPAKSCKLVAFVPDADLAKVSAALFAAGAGEIGHYRECSYRVPGTGTFFGTATTNPAVGSRGRREEVSEWRLEVLVPEARVEAAVTAVRAAHSYEEPALDVYPLRPATSHNGEGRVGDLPAPTPLAELAKSLREKLGATVVQCIGDPERVVRRVAVACGAAGEFLPDAVRSGAELFVTGELRFHDGLAAEAAGLAVLLPGHHATERPGVEDLAVRLAAAFPAARVFASRRERDPFGAAP